MVTDDWDKQQRTVALSETEPTIWVTQKMRAAARSHASLVVLSTTAMAIVSWLGRVYFSPEIQASLWVIILILVLIIGPGRFALSALAIVWNAIWVPVKISVIWIANNWEAAVILTAQLLVWAGRQKWTIFFAAIGMIFAHLAAKFAEPLAAYVAVAAGITLVCYRLVDQFKAHLNWNAVLEDVARRIEQHATNPKDKPKLKKNVIFGDEVGDAQFGNVASELASYWIVESIIAKLKRQYFKLTMHILAMLSLTYSISIMYLAACIAAVGICTLVMEHTLSANWGAVAISLLKDVLLVEKSDVPAVSTIALCFRLLVAVQVMIFLRTIFETTKTAVDQFLKGLEKSLGELQARKAAEITFVFGRSPDELGTAIKKRGKQYGEIIEAVRSGRTSEAVKLLESSKQAKKAETLLSHDPDLPP